MLRNATRSIINDSVWLSDKCHTDWQTGGQMRAWTWIDTAQSSTFSKNDSWTSKVFSACYKNHCLYRDDESWISLIFLQPLGTLDKHSIRNIHNAGNLYATIMKRIIEYYKICKYRASFKPTDRIHAIFHVCPCALITETQTNTLDW